MSITSRTENIEFQIENLLSGYAEGEISKEEVL